MTPEQFIEKAIEGGYHFKNDIDDRNDCVLVITQSPKAWESVGKVEGWGKEELCGACNLYLTEEGEEPCPQEGWKHKMLGMIDALIEGKTIEDYLLTL